MLVLNVEQEPLPFCILANRWYRPTKTWNGVHFCGLLTLCSYHFSIRPTLFVPRQDGQEVTQKNSLRKYGKVSKQNQFSQSKSFKIKCCKHMYLYVYVVVFGVSFVQDRRKQAHKQTHMHKKRFLLWAKTSLKGRMNTCSSYAINRS